MISFISFFFHVLFVKRFKIRLSDKRDENVCWSTVNFKIYERDWLVIRFVLDEDLEHGPAQISHNVKNELSTNLAQEKHTTFLSPEDNLVLDSLKLVPDVDISETSRDSQISTTEALQTEEQRTIEDNPVTDNHGDNLDSIHVNHSDCDQKAAIANPPSDMALSNELMTDPLENDTVTCEIDEVPDPQLQASTTALEGDNVSCEIDEVPNPRLQPSTTALASCTVACEIDEVPNPQLHPSTKAVEYRQDDSESTDSSSESSDDSSSEEW